MSQLSKVLRSLEDMRLLFWCPGCEHAHQISYAPGRWAWNGDSNKPTFSPSVLVTYRHPQGCTDDAPAPAGHNLPYVEDRCHSFVTGGRIQFLPDCTHNLAGQTVDLPELPEQWRDA